ncbi:MAG: histidine ammonia-lyase [Myxococcota bacterium]
MSFAALEIGTTLQSLENLLALARGTRRGSISTRPEYRARLDAEHAVVGEALARGESVYGVTTGVGSSVVNSIDEAHRSEFVRNLFRMLGTGVGAPLPELESAAVMAARTVSLAAGHSGVRALVLERLCELLEARCLPRIPELGSVGASGDLAPLSYIAGMLAGEGKVRLRGRVIDAAEAHESLGLLPLAFEPKETLSLVNGTSFMTGLGAVAWERSVDLARLGCAITAMASEATRGNPRHFDSRIAEWKPHLGQIRAAKWIREHLEYDPSRPIAAPARLQDRYSIRCAPNVLGVLLDAAELARGVLEVELNGANDNPLVDADTGEILHGGNFYGGHLCFALDSLKSAVASVADLLDRQLALLCRPETSEGLPAELISLDDAGSRAHHGFKGMQVTASALAAEALKLTMPAAAFSRSTESHNQDKVSMGSIAARESLRILDLTEGVAAIALLAVCQCVDLRGGARSRATRRLHEAVRKHVPMLRADRRQDADIALVVDLVRAQALPLVPAP